MAWLKLDWDNINEQTMARRVMVIFKNLRMMPIVYKTKHGYHVYVWVSLTDTLKDEPKLFQLRRKYWDDPLRIRLDLERIKRGQPHDVLFHDKSGRPRELLEPNRLLNIIDESVD
tara:strand:- start:2672 stop:3016 length:345 start_codon:yes stop_codon:yes gene_type:complete